MAKILAPHKGYNGVSASVKFKSGVGQCDDPYLLKWLSDHGYEVIEDVVEEPAGGEEIPNEEVPESINIELHVAEEAKVFMDLIRADEKPVVKLIKKPVKKAT